MLLEEFIIWVYCWTDENMSKVLGDVKLRSRGFQPKLSDSEIITMEIVGEFLSYGTDMAIWTYFKTHWLSFFLNLLHVQVLLSKLQIFGM
jgi:hypothetical protein